MPDRFASLAVNDRTYSPHPITDKKNGDPMIQSQRIKLRRRSKRRKTDLAGAPKTIARCAMVAAHLPSSPTTAIAARHHAMASVQFGLALANILPLNATPATVDDAAVQTKCLVEYNEILAKTGMKSLHDF